MHKCSQTYVERGGYSLKKIKNVLLLIKWFYSNGGVADVLEGKWQTKNQSTCNMY